MGLALAFVVLMVFFMVVAFIGAQQQKVYRSRAYGEPTKPPVATRTPTPTPLTCAATKPKGDANCNGKIDGIDYSIWLNSQCQPGANQSCADLRADFNGDHKVNDDDYQIWFKNRGT